MEQVNSQEARKLSIQRYIQSLVHVWQCRDTNCRLPSCQNTKRVLLTHTKICKRKTRGDCPICKHLIALCCYHAKHCQETICPVLFCSNIKQKLKLKQQKRQAQRKAVMQLLTTLCLPPSPNQQQQIMEILNSNPPLLAAFNKKQQQMAAAPEQTQPQVHQEAVQQLMAMLRMPPSHNQRQEIQKILKSNPGLIIAFIKQRQFQNAQNQEAAASSGVAQGEER